MPLPYPMNYIILSVLYLKYERPLNCFEFLMMSVLPLQENVPNVTVNIIWQQMPKKCVTLWPTNWKEYFKNLMYVAALKLLIQKSLLLLENISRPIWSILFSLNYSPFICCDKLKNELSVIYHNGTFRGISFFVEHTF